jgi:hypothetical protein
MGKYECILDMGMDTCLCGYIRTQLMVMDARLYV